MRLKIDKYDVELKDSLKWGDVEQLQLVLGAKPGEAEISTHLEANYKVLEICVISIKEDGKEVPFSQEWVKDLEFSAALELIEAATGLLKKNRATTGGQS
jgi:hypothetical protein